jgi:hypothetical protein
MKTLQYFFFVTLATVLMAADCSNKDSEFYNDVFVYSPNHANVTLEGISPDQTIYVNATIPKLLTVPGQTNLLDIYKTTGGATKLNFTYELEKETAGVWDYIVLDQSQVVTADGEAFVGDFVYGNAIYNSTSETYEYRVGIKSLPAGNYRLSFGYNSTSTTDVEFRSESHGNNLFLNLKSAYSGLDGGGNFHFTIN